MDILEVMGSSHVLNRFSNEMKNFDWFWLKIWNTKIVSRLTSYILPVSSKKWKKKVKNIYYMINYSLKNNRNLMNGTWNTFGNCILWGQNLTLYQHYHMKWIVVRQSLKKCSFGIAILGFSEPGGREGNSFFKFEICYGKIWWKNSNRGNVYFFYWIKPNLKKKIFLRMNYHLIISWSKQEIIKCSLFFAYKCFSVWGISLRTGYFISGSRWNTVEFVYSYEFA